MADCPPVTTTSLSRRAGTFAALFGLVLVPALAGCSGENEAVAAQQREQSTRADVPLKSCDEVACTGELGGADYEIQLPDKWNGTLLIYSHGYRQAESSPPDFDPVDTEPAPAPSAETASALLAEGYALAGSAFATNGWDVLDGVKAGEQLHELLHRQDR